MIARSTGFCRTALTALALVAFGSVGPAGANDFWVAPTYQQDLGGLGTSSNTIWPVTSIGVARLAWSIPDDLQTFQDAKVAVITGSPGGASTLNVFVCPAENGQPVVTGCAGPFSQAFTGVPNQLAEVGIGSLISSRIGTPGANYLAILAYTTPTTATDHIVGLRFSYAPKTPAGVATLGPNTFTGTQEFDASLGIGGPPAAQLHVQSAGAAEARIESSALTGPAMLTLSSGVLGGNKVFRVQSMGTLFSIRDQSAGKNRLTINNQGAVGIGTDLVFPQGKLDVVNDATDSVVAISGTANTSAGVGVWGQTNQSGGIGVHGTNTGGGFAALFDGWVRVTGPMDISGSATLVGGATIGSGINHNGGGLKHARAPFSIPAGCTDGGVTWTTAFADANYTVILSLQLTSDNFSEITVWVTTQTAAGVSLRFCNNAAFPSPASGVVHVVAIHD